MYCSKCGKKLEDDAVFCSGCGFKIGEIHVNNSTGNDNVPSKGKSVASLVLGIVGLLLGLLYLAASLEIDPTYVSQISESFAFKLGYAIGSVLLPGICAIIGMCLAVSAKKQQKNGLNTAGFILTLITFVLCGIITIIVFTV